MLKRAIPVLQRATPLIRDARLIARRLGKARPGLVKMLNLLPEPLTLFEPALEVINSESVHGAPAVSQLVAGGFTGFDASFRAFQTQQQNPQAPGHALRVGTEFDFAGIAEGLQGSPRARSSATDGRAGFPGGERTCSKQRGSAHERAAADI